MKSWNDLDSHQQKQAVKRNLKHLALSLVDGVIQLEDNKRQALLDNIVETSTTLESAVKNIMASALGKEIYNLAKTAAEGGMFNELGMQVPDQNSDENFPLFV